MRLYVKTMKELRDKITFLDKDREKLKSFTQDQKNIRWKYRMKMVENVDQEEFKKVIADLQKAFKEMAGDNK